MPMPAQPTRPPGFRQAMASLHTWVGLLMGWLLYTIFLMGSMSCFRHEISLWMRPEIPLSTPHPNPTQTTRHLLDTLQRQAPHALQWGVSLPTQRQPTASIYWLAGERQIHQRLLDPQTAAPLQVRNTLGGEFFYLFHFNLYHLQPRTARWIVGLATMFMLVAILSGIIIHKKIFTDFFTFRWGKGQRSWLDAHNGMSVLGLPFHLIIAYTGLVSMMFQYMPWGVTAAFRTPSAQQQFQQMIRGTRAPEPASHRPMPLASVVPMMQQAQQRWGQQGIGRLLVNNPGDTGTRVMVLRRDDSDVNAHPQFMLFDGNNGQLLQTHEQAAPAAGTYGVLLALHKGHYAQPPLRWLYFLLGLSGAGMMASGLVLWTIKRWTRLKSGQSAGFGLILVEKLNIAVLVGLPLAMTAYLWANRLLPLALVQRSNCEVSIFFSVWATAAGYATLRPTRRAWTELLSYCGIMLTPLINALTTARGILSSLAQRDWTFVSIDLTTLLFGVLMATIAWRTRRPPSKKPPGPSRKRPPHGASPLATIPPS